MPETCATCFWFRPPVYCGWFDSYTGPDRHCVDYQPEPEDQLEDVHETAHSTLDAVRGRCG